MLDDTYQSIISAWKSKLTGHWYIDHISKAKLGARRCRCLAGHPR